MLSRAHYRREFHIRGYQGWYYENEEIEIPVVIFCFLFIYPISGEIIYDIDVASLCSNSLSAILIKFDGTLVILIDNIVVDILSLLFQEVLGTYHLCQDIVHI